MKDMKKIYQKLALTGVLAALLLSAGCGGAKETSANETAGEKAQRMQSRRNCIQRHWKQIPGH
jgi:hypothetical protein